MPQLKIPHASTKIRCTQIFFKNGIIVYVLFWSLLFYSIKPRQLSKSSLGVSSSRDHCCQDWDLGLQNHTPAQLLLPQGRLLSEVQPFFQLQALRRCSAARRSWVCLKGSLPTSSEASLKSKRRRENCGWKAGSAPLLFSSLVALG